MGHLEIETYTLEIETEARVLDMCTSTKLNYYPPRVAMFRVKRGEGAVMLSYNPACTRGITNPPCTPPAPCALGYISHSGTSPMHMCVLLCAAL